MHVRFYLLLPISVTVTIFTVSAFIFLTLTPNILQSFPNVSSSVPSTALDRQHFLKPFAVTSGEMCYHAVLIQID